MRRVLVHGLCVASDVELGTSRPAPDDRPVDVRISTAVGSRVPQELPSGEVVGVAADGSGKAFYTITSLTYGPLLARVHGIADVTIAAGGARAHITLDPATDPQLAPVLASGLVLALVLHVRGHGVLHASAIELDGCAVAITGASGMGKSTLAGMCCAAGSRLLTDDVLRFDATDGAVVAHAGAAELRLRRGATALAQLLGGMSRESADERALVSPPVSELAAATLGAVLIPARSPDSNVLLEALGPGAALRALLRFPRVVGLEHPGMLAVQLDRLAMLAARVPVAVVSLPAGPPFSALTARRVLDALHDLDQGRARPSTNPEACRAYNSA